MALPKRVKGSCRKGQSCRPAAHVPYRSRMRCSCCCS
jgi:hypothetical protein